MGRGVGESGLGSVDRRGEDDDLEREGAVEWRGATGSRRENRTRTEWASRIGQTTRAGKADRVGAGWPVETRVNRNCPGWCCKVRMVLAILSSATGWALRGDEIKPGWRWWAGAVRVRPGSAVNPRGCGQPRVARNGANRMADRN